MVLETKEELYSDINFVYSITGAIGVLAMIVAVIGFGLCVFSVFAIAHGDRMPIPIENLIVVPVAALLIWLPAKILSVVLNLGMDIGYNLTLLNKKKEGV